MKEEGRGPWGRGGGTGGTSAGGSDSPTADAFSEYGLDEFLPGGAYGPDYWVQRYKELAGEIARANTPTPAEAQRYAYAIMDPAARASSLQTGIAARGLEGMNPAARAGALSSIAQGGTATASGVASQGYGQGLGALQNTALSNQQAVGNRQGLLGSLFGSGMQNASNVGLAGLQGQLAEYQQRMQMAMLMKQLAAQQSQQEASSWGNLFSSIAPLLFLI